MEVLDFSDNNLAKVLSNHYSSELIIEKKNHFRYLKDYLGSTGLSAKKIVLEEKYVSRDYLHDYTSYYAYCFEDYKKYCTRVHFFGNDFSEKELKDAITAQDTERANEIWQSYLGFIVVKPIPITVIGFTILKTYPNGTDFGSRNFWGIREYKVHFFGKELKVDSLAFQEQDSVVAACATTSIWSMLNKASTDHYTILKSPIHITKDADNVSSDGSRLFPNNGLNILQISQAIYNSGLVCEIKQADDVLKDSKGNIILRVVSNSYLKKIVNAYSPVGIPIILIINVPNVDRYGLHAVTVSGYKKQAQVVIQPKNEISYLAENIERLYAHDDQWGPFVRVSCTNHIELELPWSQFHPKNNPTYTTNVVVPLYPKIRISYEDIDVITLGLDAILTLFFGKSLVADLVWDIKLSFSEDFKSSIHGVNSLTKQEKEQLLTQSLPKYIWVVSCYVSNSKILDFTFDATDIKHGMIGLHVVCYLSAAIRTQLNSFLSLNQQNFEMLFRHRASSIYYQFLIDQTK